MPTQCELSPVLSVPLKPAAAAVEEALSHESRKGRSSWLDISAYFAVFLFLYIFSMVPIGRLYMGSYLQPGSWHDQLFQTAYSPLLYIISRNQIAYDATLTYSNGLSHMILSTESREKAGYTFKPTIFAIDGPVYPSSWWWISRNQVLGQLLDDSRVKGISRAEEDRLCRMILGVCKDP